MNEGSAVGVVGLGVMGRNLVLNMTDHEYAVAAHDPWPEARADFAGRLAGAGPVPVTLADDPGALVRALLVPRLILVMVKAGAPVDDVIAGLVPHLEAGDVVIDGGNSHFQDTIRREAEFRARGQHFLGLGVSGGGEGARRGPSMMAGGDAAAYERARPMLEAIAARFDGVPCCARVGPDGAGHFVKMVHNGIEYGLMQLIAESYLILHRVAGLDHAGMAGLFRRWNGGALSSYLVEITAGILDRNDPDTGRPLVEMILDRAGQKGTGRWSSEAALAEGVPAPTITEAVFARALAAMKDQRVAAADLLGGPSGAPAIADGKALAESLADALLGAFIATYAQGFAVIEAASQSHGWNVDPGEVAAIWRAGCVIRSALINDAAQALAERPANLMLAPPFARHLARVQPGWRAAVRVAVEQGLPVPALSSALAYFDGYRSAQSGANLIQAQRDFFGAHGFERTDRPGTFHGDW